MISSNHHFSLVLLNFGWGVFTCIVIVNGWSVSTFQVMFVPTRNDMVLLILCLKFRVVIDNIFSVWLFTQLTASHLMQPTYIYIYTFPIRKRKNCCQHYRMALQVFDGATPRERLMKRRYTAQFGGAPFSPSFKTVMFVWYPVGQRRLRWLSLDLCRGKAGEKKNAAEGGAGVEWNSLRKNMCLVLFWNHSLYLMSILC